MFYSLSTLETLLQRNVFFLLRECEDAVGRLMYNDDHIDETSYVTFIKWFNTAYGASHPIPAKRKYSSSHRIEIAYKTFWKCALCFKTLTPSFEVDHIVELRHGGKDVYENCAALCVSCHAKKTRANTLKKQEMFKSYYSKRADTIEKNIFENLKYKNVSTYF